MSLIAPMIILIATALGFGYYIYLARHSGKTSTIDDFILGGRRIGSDLSRETTWASSYGAANGIWYAAWLGYTLGTVGILIQAFWCMGIYLYSFLVPRLIDKTKNHTLHGYLGVLYGHTARITAAFISLLGLFVCIGFEIYYSSDFFAQMLGLAKFLPLFLILQASFIATFCSIGGFKGNVNVDRISNALATTSLVILLILIGSKISSGSALLGALGDELMLRNKGLEGHGASFYIGLLFFGLYNLIDMGNWQTIAANNKISKEEVPKLQSAVRKSAFNIFLFPIVTGTLIGFLLKLVSGDAFKETTLLKGMLTASLPSNDIIGLLIFVLVTFSFMGSSLGAANSWLLASTQTLSWDLINYRLFKGKSYSTDEMNDLEQKDLLQTSRIILISVGILVTGLVYYIAVYVWDQVFALQFVMFGAGLSMLPALLYGLYRDIDLKDRKTKLAGSLSILLGFISSIGLFGISIIQKDPNIVNHIPYTALLVSSATFALLSLTLNKKKNERDFATVN